MKLELTETLNAADLESIQRGLTTHAMEMDIEPRNVASLYVAIRDSNGLLVGGLTAVTVWRWLHVKELWISEQLRSQGWGKKMMKAAESEARRRDCQHALLDTFDFQARPFYEKLGYRTFGELNDFPLGHRRFFLFKKL
ncbi:MAG TPA: GNAT family N-acetyltransferase [Steroidobacteraceae bacterium]|nr:GNAT family N-acetyltransferase [Steroidobacteraceae bacterium]